MAIANARSQDQDQDQDQNDRWIVVLASAIAAPLSLYILSTIFLPLNGWFDRFSYSVGRDFSNFWMGGRLAATGHVAAIYDLKAYMAHMTAYFSAAQPFMNFSYPPHALALLVPFGALPFGVALPVWLATNIAALLAIARLTGTRWSRDIALMILAAPAVLFMLSIGQATAILALLFIVGVRSIDQKPVLAGVLLGILSVKPHLCLLLPFVLLLRQAWVTIVAAVATIVVLIAISLIMFGVEPWQAYVATTLPYQARVIANPFGFVWTIMVSPYAWYVNLGATPGLAMGLHLVTAVPVATFGLKAYLSTRDRDPALGVAALAFAAIAVVPYSLSYDLVLPTAALALWLTSSTCHVSRAIALALAMFLAMPVIGQVLYMADIFIAWPLTCAALVALLWQALGRESEIDGPAKLDAQLDVANA
jgi:hypothetical protein